MPVRRQGTGSMEAIYNSDQGYEFMDESILCPFSSFKFVLRWLKVIKFALPRECHLKPEQQLKKKCGTWAPELMLFDTKTWWTKENIGLMIKILYQSHVLYSHCIVFFAHACHKNVGNALSEQLFGVHAASTLWLSAHENNSEEQLPNSGAHESSICSS